MRVIAFHVQHDASVAVAEDGHLRAVLELERLFESRYFASAAAPEDFEAQWRQAIDAVTRATGLERFDVAVTSWVMPSQRRALARLVRADRWATVDHHRAHALHGLHDAGLGHALVVSYDGGGNDGSFNVFRASGGVLERVERVALNLGTPYRLLATAMPEVTRGQPQPRAGHLSLAGKLMAYAALGEARAAWLPAVRDYYLCYQEPSQALYSLGEALGLELEPDSLGEEDARSLASTSQLAFEEILLSHLRRHLRPDDRDLVLTGGCALNVVANERVRRECGRAVHVPPAPNDAGISVGALWSVEGPRERPSAFVGMPLVADVTERELRDRGAIRSSRAILARLLLEGAIVGVARGRAELGPRALGHRSILAYPDRVEVRDRINARIKSREWYRPVAPVVLAARAERVVHEPPNSPYMSFAPSLTEDARRRFPAISHVDGTARLQTVEDGFLAELLSEVERLGGTPVLANTSFNLRGRPLLHRASSAVAALDQVDLDYVQVEDWLLAKNPDVAARFGTGGSP